MLANCLPASRYICYQALVSAHLSCRQKPGPGICKSHTRLSEVPYLKF